MPDKDEYMETQNKPKKNSGKNMPPKKSIKNKS